MSRKSTSKKPRKTCQQDNDYDNDEDFITKLPERVITNILSRLHTKTAVQTSVLSKKWEFKWTYVYSVNIMDRGLYGHKTKKSSFVNFVDRVLFLSHELTTFRLTCREKYDSSRLLGWISSAFKSKVERFELEVENPKGLVLPRSLLNSASTLRKLKLAMSCTFRAPMDSYFPNLTSLYLKQVEIRNMFSDSDPLVFTFPVLSTFELQNCKWTNVNLVEIHSPKLTKYKCMSAPGAVVTSYSIKICGARIDKFESSGGFPEETVFYESSVRKAYFRNSYKVNECESESDEDASGLRRGLQVRKLLKELPRVPKLLLSYSMCEAIALAKQELPLPRNDWLQRLTMSVCRDTKLLFELLHSAPSLRFLKIHGHRKKIDCDEVYSVPCCVTSHLEEIKFVDTPGKSLICLAEFFLKNGVVLKKVCLGGGSCWSQIDRLVDQLLKLPRASACLAIVDDM